MVYCVMLSAQLQSCVVQKRSCLVTFHNSITKVASSSSSSSRKLCFLVKEQLKEIP